MGQTPKKTSPVLLPTKKVWLLKVGAEQSRLRLPAEIEPYVPWIKQGEGVAVIGPWGGISILPSYDLQEEGALVGAIDRYQVSITDLGSPLTKIAQHRNSSYPVKILSEPKSKRYSITLPKLFIELKLIPRRGNFAAVLATGGILEIWIPEEFVAHIQGVGRNLRNLKKEVIEELNDEGDL